MTTKNQCCESCIPPKVKLGGVIDYPMGCQNTSCKCHQNDSVVEEIVEEYNFLRDRFGNDYNFNVWLYHKLTALQQTAQQEKEEAVKEAYDHAEIVRQRTINEIRQAVEDDIPYGGAKENIYAILDRFIS